MPIDPSIALSFKPAQFADPLEAQARRQQIQANALAMRSQRSALERQNALSQRFAQGGDFSSPEFISDIMKIDPDKGMQLQQFGAQMGRDVAATKASEAQVSEIEAKREEAKVVKTSMSFIYALGSDASDASLDTTAKALRSAGIPEDQIESTIAPIRALPVAKRRNAMMSQLMTSEQGRAALAVASPKVEKIDVGNKIILRDMNTLSPTYGTDFGELKKGLTPGEAAQITQNAQRLAFDQARAVIEDGFKREEIDAKKPKEGVAEAAAATQDQKYNSIKATISEAKALVGPGESGFLGPIASKIGGTKARTLAGKINTIKANLGFEQLQRMREASPTGGALGQVAVKELERLESTVASLDLGLPTSELLNSLKKVEEHYDAWNAAVQKSRTAAPSGGGWGKASVVPGAK